MSNQAQNQQRNQQNQNLPAAQSDKHRPLSAMMPSAAQWEQIRAMGAAAAKSGLLPGSIRTPEAAAIVALKAWELGIPLMQAYSQLFVLDGKVGMDAALMRMLAQRNVKGFSIAVVEESDQVCKLKFQAQGRAEYISVYTIEEAKRAQLTSKAVWQKYPRDMLYNRALARGVRRFCPEAIGGPAYLPEEMESIETTGRRIPENEKVPASGTPQPVQAVENAPMGTPDVEATTHVEHPMGSSSQTAPAERAPVDAGDTAIEVKAEVQPTAAPSSNPVSDSATGTQAVPSVADAQALTETDLQALQHMARTRGCWPSGSLVQYMNAKYGSTRLSQLSRAQYEELFMTVARKSDAEAMAELGFTLTPPGEPSTFETFPGARG